MGLERYDELIRLVQEAREQHEQVLKGRKVAAIRARKALQQIKRAAQACRVEIQETKKVQEGPNEEKPLPPTASGL
jgi:hypothetical protein